MGGHQSTKSGDTFHPGLAFTCEIRTSAGTAPGRNWDLVPELVKALPVPYHDHLQTWRIFWRTEGEDIICTPLKGRSRSRSLDPGVEKRLPHNEPLRFALALSAGDIGAQLVPPPALDASWSLYLVLEPKSPPANANPLRQLEFSLRKESSDASTLVVKGPGAQGLALLVATGKGLAANANGISGYQWLLDFGGTNFAGDWTADLRLSRGAAAAPDTLARTMTADELGALAAQSALLAPIEFNVDETSPRLSSRPLPVLIGLLRRVGADERLAAYGPEPTLWLPELSGPDATKVTWIHRGEFLDAVPFDTWDFQYRLVLLPILPEPSRSRLQSPLNGNGGLRVPIPFAGS